MKHLKNFELFEGKTEKAAKTGNKNTETKEDKTLSMRKKVTDEIKSLEDVKTKEDGKSDLSVYFKDEHVAQVMFRKDYIGVKKVGERDVSEFGYDKTGSVRGLVREIIKSKKMPKNK